MPDSSQANDVVSYASAVRAALEPLPEAQRESLLEDLENHLAEVAGESGVSLQERLGRPEDYAAELRSAYGAGNDVFNIGRRRPLRDRAAALLKTVSSHLPDGDLRAFLPELRPGWWVVRAYLVVLFLAFVFRDGSPDPYVSAASAGYFPGVTNIYPYSKDGKPLKDVLLYDQNGRPLVPEKTDIVIDVPNGPDGLPIPNAYPLNERQANGDPVLPPRVALPPAQTSAPTPSPTVTPSP